MRPPPHTFAALLTAAALLLCGSSTAITAGAAAAPVHMVWLFDAAFADASNIWGVGNSTRPQGTPFPPRGLPALLHSGDGGSSWTSQAVPTGGGELHAITCVDAKHCWAVGLGIVGTTDGGATWTTETASVPDGDTLFDVSFVDATHGWAVAGQYGGIPGQSAGGILATTDGGATWQAQTFASSPSGEKLSAEHVQFVSQTVGWVSGVYCPPYSGQGTPGSCYSSVILATTDAGKTWTVQSDVSSLPNSATAPRLSMLSASSGYASVASGATPCVPHLYATSDAGAHWTLRAALPTYASLNAVFTSATRGWVSSAPPVGGCNAPAAPALWTTGDGGLHWSPQPFPADAGSTISAIRFLSSTGEGIAVGNGFNEDPAQIVLTANAGASWHSYPHAALVRHAYVDLLGRAADAGGLGYWSGRIDSGLSRSAVMNALDTTAEYRSLQVAAMYTRLLHRAADAGGLSYFTGLIAAGRTYEAAASIMLSLAEYYGSRGGGTDAGWIKAVYSDVLNRTADSNDQAYWLGQLGSGASRQAVAYRIVTSTEALGDAVSGLYSKFLQRTPDSGGLSYWTDLLAHGMRDETLIATLTGTDEYYESSVSY